MTSLADNGHEAHYDINFLQDPQLTDSPRALVAQYTLAKPP